MKRRIISVILAAVMVLTTVDITAFAQETETPIPAETTTPVTTPEAVEIPTVIPTVIPAGTASPETEKTAVPTEAPSAPISTPEVSPEETPLGTMMPEGTAEPNATGMPSLEPTDNNETSYLNSAVNIPDDAFSYEGHYYKIYNINKSWDDAKKFCEEVGGHLATVTSEEEYSVILQNCGTANAYYWLGGTDKYREGNWEWLTGEAWDYAAWEINEPNNYANNEHFLEFFTQSGKWNDLDDDGSNLDLNFVCEWDEFSGRELEEGKKAKGQCGDNLLWTLEEGILTISGNGEMFSCAAGSPWDSYKDEIKRVVFNEGIENIADSAFKGCSQITGNLIFPNSVKSIGKNAFEDCSGLTGNLVIGEAVASIGDYAFSGCSGLEGIAYISDNVGIIGKEALSSICLIYGKVDSYVKMYAEENNIGFIDEASSIGYFGNNKYEILGSYGRDACVTKCQESGGYLLTINTEEEQRFIEEWMYIYYGSKSTAGACWLGAVKDSDWKWLTGELFSYVNWNTNEPSGDGSYIIMNRDGRWNDGTYGSYLAICETVDNQSGKPGDLDTSADEAIIAEVRKYTSDEEYAQWNAIINSGFSAEEKFRQLNELSHNKGITDIKEGIQYFREVSAHRRDYLYLTTNENYCAFNWWYWLNTTLDGQIARGLLYADGLIFNFELSAYMDWSTYANSKYPGVEKCKTMLKDFMEINDNETLATDAASDSKQIAKSMKNAVKLNDIVCDAEMDEIMNKVLEAKTDAQREIYQEQFANCFMKQLRVQQKIKEGDEVKLYLGTEGLADALDYAVPVIELAADTTEDIVGIMNLENEIQKYKEYENFLTTVYSSSDVSTEMRVAAYQLHDEIENGYMEKVKSIVSNFIVCGTELMYVDKSLLATYLESQGMSAATTELFGGALKTLKLATVISNIVVDAQDFVKQAAYTMSYAELSTLYSLKLQEDKTAFLKDPSPENAWQFYEDYNLLWRLRYNGEEQYLKMNSVKLFVFGKIKSYGYDYKEDVVNDTLSVLEKCKFELADSVTVPESLQYIKKSVIECPVDVLVYTKEGTLIAELKDGVISDVINEYGRFSVVYESYSGEYAKVICQSTDDELDIQIISMENGLVDYKSAQVYSSDVMCFDKVPVKTGDIIRVENDSYQVIREDGSEIITEPLASVSDSYVKPEKISVKEFSVELSTGQKKVLDVSVLPDNATNKSLNWYSENEEVAEIKNGVITAEMVGETVIQVRTCDNENIVEKINVKVIEEKEPQADDVLPEDIPTDGIVLDGIWIAGISDENYTAGAVTQNFRVYDNRKLLKEKTDYTVSYKNNKNAYTYADEDYAVFEENLQITGKKVKVGSFDPAKAPQIIIKMKGNYSGNRTVYFRIAPADIKGSGFEIADLAVTYSGKKQTPAPVLTWNGVKLRYGTDFFVPEYDAAKSDKTAFAGAGTYNLTVTGKNNFTGEIPITFTISESSMQIALNKVAVKGIVNLPWTGEQLTQSDYKVTYQKDFLSEENGDYTVSWGNNTDVGTGTVTFTGTGTDNDGDGYSYIGTRTVSFKITGTAISRATVSGVEKSYTYTGDAIEPEAVLTYKADKNTDPQVLTEGVHYTVSYQKNVEKGTAAVIFTGLESGGYTGTKKITFKIVASGIGDKKEGESLIEQAVISFKDEENVQDGIYTASYMKGGAKPEIVVTSGGRALKAGTDYTVSYSNNKKAALSTDKNAPTITVKGKGNYSGSKKIYFSIAAKTLTNENGIMVTASDKVESLKKNGYRQNFKVYDADGIALGSGDYDTKSVVYTLIRTVDENGEVKSVNEVLNKDSIVQAGSVIQITVEGKGVYAGGTASGTYRILEKNCDISKATIQINAQTYTGREVTITDQSQFADGKVFIKVGGEKKELILGEDIEVVEGSYMKNVDKGTAKVTFRGINDFGGTKTVSYKIGTRSIGEFWKGIYTRLAGLF